MRLTRNGVTLWCLAGAALVAYLISASTPPTAWTYHDWLQFFAAVFAWGVGKLQASPLPSRDQVAAADLGTVSSSTIAVVRKDAP